MIRNQNEEETDNLSPWHLRNLSDLSTEFTDQKQKNQLKSNERQMREQMIGRREHMKAGRKQQKWLSIGQRK